VAGHHRTAPASRGYTGGFGAELMLKDLGWPPKRHARRTSR
jgi:hypothetical protein